MPGRDGNDFWDVQSEALKTAIPLAVEKFKLDRAQANLEKATQEKMVEHRLNLLHKDIEMGLKYDNLPYAMNASKEAAKLLGMPEQEATELTQSPKSLLERRKVEKELRGMEKDDAVETELGRKVSAQPMTLTPQGMAGAEPEQMSPDVLFRGNMIERKPLSPEQILQTHAQLGSPKGEDAAKALLKAQPKEDKNLTKEQLAARSLKEQLGREPTATEIEKHLADSDVKSDFATFKAGMPKKQVETDAAWNNRVSNAWHQQKIKESQAARSVFGIIPNQQTGAYFDRNSKKWFINTDNGKVELSSDQVKNLGLQVKEEATASDIKSMQQSAPAVLDFTKKLKKQITDAENGLGPAASRWREFKQGKIGLEDPAFTAIKTNIDLMVTRLMKMHVGSRGSEYIMKEFKNMVDFGKQSPENLKASISQIDDYAAEAAKGRIPKRYEKAIGGGKEDPLGLRK